MNRSDTTAAGRMPSGRFVLRLDPRLHAALRAAAREAGISLNEYCTRKLAAPGLHVVGPEAVIVARAAAVVGDALVGIVAFGSWARDELVEGSDLDVLVVVEPRVSITRELYRRWDTLPLVFGSHLVEPHFVRIPESEARVSGLWAEAAVEGIVLFERGLVLSRTLVRIRRRILAGHMVRRQVHGLPYWVEAA